jgi:hypothetical protein
MCKTKNNFSVDDIIFKLIIFLKDFYMLLSLSLHARSSFTAKCVTLLFLVGVSLTFSYSLVYAQGAGVRISPAMIEESVDPGTVMDYKFSIENLTNNEVVYYLFPLNISGIKGGGVPIFAKDNNEQTGYEMADWINLSVTEVTLPANGSVSVPFTISLPEDATPGSHFAGVFVSVDPPKIERSGAAVGYQVANIISLRVSGDIIDSASIRQFSTGKFLYGSQNVDFLVRIENSGNVLVRPTGPLEIFNMLGNQVGNVTFNAQESAVFPYDSRDFVGVSWEGDSVGFGRYEAILSPSYGDAGAKKTMSNTVTFWILPMNIIGPILAVLALMLIVTFIFIRLYIRRSLEYLNHNRRLVSRRRKKGSSATLLVTVVMLTAIALFLIVLLALFA